MPQRAMTFDASPIGFAALEAHRAFALAHDAHDRFQRRGLADAVPAEQRHHFAGPHLKGHAVQDVQFTVPALEIFHGEHRIGHSGS